MKKNNRFEILFTISTGLLVLYVITNSKYLLYGIICFNVITLLIKPLSELVGKAWMKLAEILNIVTSTILLSLIYYFFLTPIAFLYKVFNGNNMKKKCGVKDKSMFTDRNYTYTSKDLDYTW